MRLSSKNIANLILIFFSVLFLSGCYTLNPGTTSGARTLNIRNFNNLASQGPPIMPQLFSEKLRSYYQQNSNLSIVNSSADWLLEGAIIRYEILPVAPQQNQTIGANRLTIAVKATFVNNLDPKRNFDQVFSFYEDFAQGVSLSQVERDLIDRIFDQIVFDIYTRTTSDW